MPIYGDGKQMREWVYVEDNCSALMTIINSNCINDTFNISSNFEISNIELFNNVADILGKGHNLVEYVKDRPGHDFRYSISAEKLRALGWEPSGKFSKLLEKTVKWYVDNEWFLKC